MQQIHPHFKLNGCSFTSNLELLEFAKINTSLYSFLSDWFSTESFVNVQTSGSTGKPKTIRLQKRFMVNSAKATGEFFNLSEKTTALLCLSTDYIAGKMMLVRALTLGWVMDIVEPTSKVEIQKEYDFSAMVPLQLRNSLVEIEKIKTLIVGGGVVANDLQAQIQNLKTNIFATYGMTETVTHIAVKKLNNFSVNSPKDVTLSAVERSHYETLPNIKITQDSRSCLVINAPKISEEKIITNDIVHLISETKFEWLGRFDNVINSGGVKLHPEKIEEKLSKIINQRFFVAGIPDNALGEKLILIIESGVISSEVEKSYKERISGLKILSKYEIPKAIYLLKSFVETETNKIQRKQTLKTLDF